LQPAAAQLQGKKTLVIVPDGFLWQLPFQALEDGRGRYVIETQAVFYTPSLTVLNQMLRMKSDRPRAQTVLGVGAAPIEEMRREVTGIQQIYGSARTRVLLGPDADEQQILRDAPQSGVVHLAAHGVFRDENPMSSYLILARAGKVEAGQLEARD